jgi:hypothetical protein
MRDHGATAAPCQRIALRVVAFHSWHRFIETVSPNEEHNNRVQDYSHFAVAHG